MEESLYTPETKKKKVGVCLSQERHTPTTTESAHDMP